MADEFPPGGDWFDDLDRVAEVVPMRAANANGSKAEQPTTDQPLRGLKHLGPIALVGRERILALASEPIEYVWQDIVIGGSIVLMAGPSGEGKTTLLFLAMAARLSLDGPTQLLERWIAPAPEGKWVVIIEGEHGENSAARKLQKSLAIANVDDRALSRVVLIARKAVIIGSEQWADVERMVAAGIVSDIAIDTLARCAPSDANAEREQVEIFDRIARTIEAAPGADREKPIVWIVAHTRKKESGDVHIQDVSGSAQRVGQADTVIMVNGRRAGDDRRITSSRVTFEKLREEPENYPAAVDFSIEGTSIGGAAPRDERPLKVRFAELLEQHGPQTKYWLRTQTKRNDVDAEAAITELFKEHRITAATVTARGKSQKVFALRQISPDVWPHEVD